MKNYQNLNIIFFRFIQKKKFHKTFNYLVNRNISKLPYVAIVGSGPAGFYTAQHLIKGNPDLVVDIYEKYPVPFGLVRFGIAPDHPEVKNVVNTFTQIGKHERVNFLGNVLIGKDLKIKDLLNNYTAVILSYGASEDKNFDLPGENLKNILSARSFVGWYNGVPELSKIKLNLETDKCIILGQGNVAIDAARILLTPVDQLKQTDITEYALEKLSKSKVKEVFMVGRRGPLHVAFTTAELREMVKLEGCNINVNPQDYEEVENKINDIPKTRKRLIELQLKCAKNQIQSAGLVNKKLFHLKFLRSPNFFKACEEDNSKVSGVKFFINNLQGEFGMNQKAIPTDKEEYIEGGLVLKSIGYKSLPLEEDIPFDTRTATVPNNQGRVENNIGLYCSGWVKRGPIGVLATTMNDAFETGKAILDDLNAGKLILNSKQSDPKIILLPILKEKGIEVVRFSDWDKLDQIEKCRGIEKGKLREKIVNIDEMIKYVKLDKIF